MVLMIETLLVREKHFHSILSNLSCAFSNGAWRLILKIKADDTMLSVGYD